jgi:cell division protein FtsW (lipid II flippase)
MPSDAVTPLVTLRVLPRALAASRAERWELGLVLGVLLVLVVVLHGLHSVSVQAAQDRYWADQMLAPAPLARQDDAAVATLCHRTALPPRPRWHWRTVCEDTRAQEALDAQSLPTALQARLEALQQALREGQAWRRARLAPLARSQAEGVLPPNDQAMVAALTQELSTYRDRYGIDADATSLPLACAWQETQALLRRAGSDEARAVVLANQLALTQGAPQRLWWPAGPEATGSAAAALAPAAWSPGTPSACAALGAPVDVIARAAGIARQVHDGAELAHKARAMQRLLPSAPWLLLLWSLLCWALLQLARRTRRPGRFLGVALPAWAAAGAVSGLALPGSGAPVPWWGWGALALAGFGIGLAARAPRLERLALLAPCVPLRSASPLTLPLLLLFMGLGWALVLDLSLHGHVLNRYLGLRHAPTVFGALVLVSVLPVLAQGLAALGLRWAALLTNALRPRAGTGGSDWARPLVLWSLYAAAVLGAAAALVGRRQLTGELLSMLLVVGAAWFFLLRATIWTRSGAGGGRWLLTSLLPLLMHVGVVLAAFVLTDDLGPMLVALLSAAVFVGAFAAQALLGRGAHWTAAALLGTLASLLLACMLLGALVAFAQLPFEPAERVAARLSSMRDPFSAENDQLAHVMWLAQHTPAAGWGLGSVPWCGTLPVPGCPGVPAQAQSDYTFAALRAAVGDGLAYTLLALYLLWLALLAARRAASTSGSADLSRPHATPFAALAWLGVCWAATTIVQALVTVAGNLGVLPLTGVTWPFLSYGLWSLWRNAAVLGLVMHLPQEEGAP